MGSCESGHPRRPPAGLRTALWYARLDRLSGVLLGISAVFAPWAFGGTPSWAVRVLSLVGYTLGLLWLVKLIIRRWCGHRPARWDVQELPVGWAGCLARLWTPAMAVLTALLLIYCAVSAVNARAEYDPDHGTFEYRPHVTWLPHSYDASRTWQTLAVAAAMACYFWSARDWLLGKTLRDRRHFHPPGARAAGGHGLPHRLRLLLWVLSLNGAFLSAQALLQRWTGTDKLLWLVRPRHNAVAEAQLGPFNYRSNGAQYLNLIWPVTLGLWWRLHHRPRGTGHGRQEPASGDRSRFYHLLLPAAGLMAATSIWSLSRGGAAIAVGSMLSCTAIFWVGWRHRSVGVRLGLLSLWGCALALGVWVGGPLLEKRLELLDEGLAQRELMYETGRAMARDYPWFGTGPGTLGPVFQLYRTTPEQYWPAQLHNDWLELRITWGRLGFGLILLMFALVLMRYGLPGGIPTSWRLPLLYWVALGGCLIHARWDFPLQVSSIQHLLMLHCAALSVLSHARWKP